MKTAFLLFCFCLAGLHAASQTPADTLPPIVEAPTTTIVFDAVELDFGKVREGKVVEKTFRFRNTGSIPLIIANVKTSCGCTVPEWPMTAIPPGGRGEIVVRFDTRGKLSLQRKIITVTANTNPADSYLFLKGEVRKRRGGS